jgi:hypothetical protein
MRSLERWLTADRIVGRRLAISIRDPERDRTPRRETATGAGMYQLAPVRPQEGPVRRATVSRLPLTAPTPPKGTDPFATGDPGFESRPAPPPASLYSAVNFRYCRAKRQVRSRRRTSSSIREGRIYKNKRGAEERAAHEISNSQRTIAKRRRDRERVIAGEPTRAERGDAATWHACCLLLAERCNAVAR